MKTRFALLALLCATVAFALDVPPPPSQWVTDTAGVLQPDQLSALNRKLSDFEQSSGSQFIIYIFPSLEGQPVEDFTIRCVQKWKVGQKKYDNGLVLFVFVKDRKVRIEVGYGLEGSVTDAYSSRVIRDYIAPHFQQSDYYGGLNAASDALIAKIRGGEAPVPPANPRPSPQQGRGGGNPGFGSVIPILILIVFLVFILPMLRRRGGGCGGCLWPMLFMGGGRGGMTFGGGGGGGWGGGGGFGGFSG
ncbi:MAG TPA: TPM domain-containing protein, partial [Thermoanaerobaculia bacterium]|nr:TPM domain-containing protein [Thermoanaerobaculia bacterium]